MPNNYARYQVWIADLTPGAVGYEMQKKRPVVIVSPNSINSSRMKTVVICPLTTTIHENWPSRIQMTLNGTRSEIALDQIRTLDKSRLTSLVGQLVNVQRERLRSIVYEFFCQDALAKHAPPCP